MAVAFGRAAATGIETFEARYRLGGRTVRLRIVGERLAARFPKALAHLRRPTDETGEHALEIDLWDAEETGVHRPIRYLRDVFDRSWPYGRGGVLASQRDESAMGMQTHASTTIYDRASARIVGCIEASDRLGFFELGKPLHPLLFAWHSDHDAVTVHSGLVAREGRGVLLGGMGGSGKTTTTLLCFRAGFDFLGDDYISLSPAMGGRFTGHSIYASIWIAPDHLPRFPWLEEHVLVGEEGDGKWPVLLPDVTAAGRLTESAEIVALALPRVVGGRDTTVRPVPAAEAVLRLAPSSILQLPFIDARSALERMGELVHSVPAYQLALGTDLDQIPERVAEILAADG